MGGYFFWISLWAPDCCDNFFKSLFYVICAVLIYIRKPCQSLDRRWSSLALCITYVFTISAFASTHNLIPFHWKSQLISHIGGGFYYWGVFCLGTSFALRPALREIKTGGAYKAVRHPLYLAFLLIHAGTVLHNPITKNLVLFGLLVALSFIMIEREEKFLSEVSEDYNRYKENTKYKLIPLIY